MASVSDDFNRGDGVPLGSNWTVNGGGAQITLNRASPTSFSASYLTFTGTPPDTANMGVEWDVPVHVAGDVTGVRARCSSTSPLGYEVNLVNDGTVRVQIVVRDAAGVATQLATTDVTLAGANRVRIEVEGTTIRSYFNGVLLNTVTDGTLSSGGWGARFTTYEFQEAGDNWAAADLPGGASQDLAGAAAAQGVAAAVLQALGNRYARPLSDVSVGGWTPSAGGSLAAVLDETAADDADYIGALSATVCEIRLRGVVDPASSSGHVVRWRSPAGYTPSGGVVVSLMQGATLIAQWTTNPVAAGTTYEHTLTGTQADAITDYDDLRLRFEAVN